MASPAQKRKGRSKDYIHHDLYANALPEVPFDPKFVDFTFDPDRFVKFKTTSLEKDSKHELKTESHMGITVDLINEEEFPVIESGDELNIVEDEKDRELLREEKNRTEQEARRVQLHNQSMTFFHRTQYISSEFKHTNKHGTQESATSVEVDPAGTMDANDEMAEIERVFAAANGPVVKHPLKPKLQPVCVWPVYPDFVSWGTTYSQITFESNPNPNSDLASVDENATEIRNHCESGIVLGMKDTDDQYASYFAPTTETIQKKKEILKRTHEDDDDDDGEYKFKFQKDYMWHVLPNNEEEKTLYFALREDKQEQQFGAYYNFLQARIKLHSRRKGANQGAKHEEVVVTDRELNAVETAERQERMMLLKENE